MRRALLVVMTTGLVGAACSPDHATPSDEPPPPAVPRAQPRKPGAPRTLTVHWDSVVAATDCFFFSGPEGRDDHLVGAVELDNAQAERGSEGDQISLRIGGATFAGTFRDLELHVTRHGVHQFHGDWSVDEQIDGRVRDGEFSGSYTYQECELAHGACPGRCTIAGRLRFTR